MIIQNALAGVSASAVTARLGSTMGNSGGSTVFVGVTIASGAVSADLAGFPVYVDLANMSPAFWATVTSDGGDIRVYDSLSALVPVDIITIDTIGETGLLIFKAASILAASNNEWTIGVDGTSTALAPADANGREAVWSDYAVAYWAQGGLINRVNGDVPTTEGTINTGSGPTGWLTLAGAGNLLFDTGTTSTVWSAGSRGQAAVVAGGNDALVSFSDNITGLTSRATVAFRNTSVFGLWNNNNSWISGGTAVNNTPALLLGYHDGTTGRGLYANGSLIGSGATAAKPGGSGTSLFVGAEGISHAERLTGAIQYTWLRYNVVTAAWAAAEAAAVAGTLATYTP